MNLQTDFLLTVPDKQFTNPFTLYINDLFVPPLFIHNCPQIKTLQLCLCGLGVWISTNTFFYLKISTPKQNLSLTPINRRKLDSLNFVCLLKGIWKADNNLFTWTLLNINSSNKINYLIHFIPLWALYSSPLYKQLALC